MFKALIVDDERIVRSGIRNSINWNEYGIEMIAEAENGVGALDQVMADRPDLILLDICMPRMDGLEFAGIVKKKFPPYILLSSPASTILNMRAMR